MPVPVCRRGRRRAAAGRPGQVPSRAGDGRFAHPGKMIVANGLGLVICSLHL